MAGTKCRCFLCAEQEICEAEDTDCKRGEYFRAEDKEKVRAVSEASRNAARRFFNMKRSNQIRTAANIHQFLTDMEYERRTWY